MTVLIGPALKTFLSPVVGVQSGPSDCKVMPNLISVKFGPFTPDFARKAESRYK
jgi:hypothetical protein